MRTLKHLALFLLLLSGTRVLSGQVLLPITNERVSGASGNCGATYLHCNSITLAAAQSGTADSTNFPAVLQATKAEWATSANGGDVQHSGNQTGGSYTSTIPFDFIVATSQTCGTAVPGWEFESYTATTGALKLWINVPTLSHTSDTVLWVCYDATSVSTQQMTTSATWNSNFLSVYHHPDGTTLSLVDSTSNAQNGTATGSPTADASGQIDGAMALNGTTAYSALPNSTTLWRTTGYSVVAWINSTSTGGNFYADGSSSANNPFFRIQYASGHIKVGIRNDSGTFQLNDVTSTTFLSAGWHQVVWTDNNGTAVLYLDGTADATSYAYTPSTLTMDRSASGALLRASASLFLVGSVDELRRVTTTLSSSWVTASWNNQKSSSTFITVGTKQ